MENQTCKFESQAASLFQLYDRSGLGEISRQTLLSNLAMIDRRINQSWLNKVLFEQGIPLMHTINCPCFIKIIQALSLVTSQSEEELSND